jgi:8-oxo-dGTP pyrophosphatase MutT (NUDIX family)
MGVQFDFNFEGEEVVFDGKFIKTTKQALNGEEFERAYLGSGVAVLPVRRKEKEVLLIKEFRIHHGQSGEAPWKLVTGWVEDGHDTFLAAAQQELAEEVGASAREWEKLYDAHNRATVSSRKKYFVCYDPLFDQDIPNPDGDVILEQKWVSEPLLWEMLNGGELSWTRDMLIALIALRRLG